MTRYIDADDIQFITVPIAPLSKRDHVHYEKVVFKRGIENAPTIDAVPVRHGKWIRNDNGTYSCSVCQSWIPEQQHYYARYCLHCGARMDEDNVEQTKKKISQTL